jgi:PAS domain S-box-containing protein
VSTTKRIWIGFGTLIGVLMLVVVPMFFWLRALTVQVDEVTTVAGPLNEAAHELEIRVNGLGSNVSNYLHTGNPELRERVRRSTEHFKRYAVEYDRLAFTSEQKQFGRDAVALFDEYASLGGKLMDQHDSGQPQPDELQRFIDLRTQIDKLLDSEIQRATLDRIEEERKDARDAVAVMLRTLWILLGGGLLVALVSSLAVGGSVIRTEETLRTTLMSIGDALITVGSDGRVRSLNPVAESLTGWTTAEAAGLPLSSVFRIVNEQTRQPVPNPALKALKDGGVVGLANHTILIARDGTERAISDSAAPIRDRKGSVVGGVLVFRDVTENRKTQRRIRQSEERFRALVTATAQLVWTTDPDGRVAEDSPSWRALTGQSFEQWQGAGWLEAIHPDDRERAAQSWARAVADGAIYETEYRLRAADGSYHWMIARAVPVPDADGGIREWVGMNIDVTERREAEERLRSSEARKAAIIEVALDAIIKIDHHGNVIEFNPAAERMFGYRRADVIGREMAGLIITPDQRESHHQGLAHFLATGEGPILNQHLELTAMRADGSEFPVEVAVTSVMQGGFPRFIGYLRDLTERRRLEQERRQTEEQFRTLVEQVKDYAIFMTDAQGRATTWNEGVGHVLGFTEDEFIGQDVTAAIFTPEDVAAGVPERELETAAAQGQAGNDRWMRRKDGTRFFATGVTTGLYDVDGRLLGFSKVMRDQTERKRLEDELRRIAADLSEADRRKDEFLATLAHELRNPLAPVRTGLEVMKLATNDPRLLEEVRDTMERQVQQLVTLVDDLLDVSRITQGKLQLRKCRVKLDDVVQSAVEATRPFITEASHTLMVSLPPQAVWLDADPHRLAQIVSNLLSNSSKYTPEGGRIDLIAERQGSDVVLTVRDTGIGIPADMLGRIFEMFTQVDRSLEKGYTGLGIGLTLVKRLVEMHGGTITAHSEGAGRGSEFTVRLPVLIDPRPDPSAECPPQRTADEAGQRRVLVVDDNEAAADMLGRVVQILGHEVRTAGDGREAIEVAAEFRPDVVLMDLGMPEMNGYEAAQHIREQPWGRGMLLIALTGWGQDEDRRRTQEAGFDHHLVKPADPAELQRLLAESERSLT